MIFWPGNRASGSSFRDFYSDILTQRTGTKTVFQFADEAAAAASKAPLTGTAMSSTSLQSMSLTDLKALAQKQGIKYAWNMNKTQLVDAISDPTKTAQIVADAKARAYGIGTTPKKPKATAPAAAKPAVTGSRRRLTASRSSATRWTISMRPLTIADCAAYP